MTVAEIAAFLGMSPSGVRQVVRRHRIRSNGRHGRALTYSPAEVLLHAGAHDRQQRRRRTLCRVCGRDTKRGA